MFSSEYELIGEMVDKDAESCYACHTADEPLEKLPMKERMRIYRIHPDSARILGIINPIYNEKSCWDADCHAHLETQTVLGVLDVKMCLKDVDKQISDSEIQSILFAVIAIIALSFIIGFFVRRWVARPVKELVKATHQVSSGNLNYTIDGLGNDELGTLGDSFNNMTNKLAEARLQLFQSDKMASLGRLAAGVAHEINNPLTGVLTYSSFLLKRTKDNSELQEDLKIIVRETKRSREIVKSLLDFARKLIGKIDTIEFPNLGLSVKKGQPLFTVKQENRSVTFNSPVSGNVKEINKLLNKDIESIEFSPYENNWICQIDAEELDNEIPQLKIGKAAVTFYQKDIEHLQELKKKTKTGNEEDKSNGQLYIGEMENLDDFNWKKYSEEFFEK